MGNPKYSTRQMRSEDSAPEEDQAFFFPKANPPRTVFARTREEAEAALEAVNKKENV